MKKVNWIVVIAGALVGLAAVLLTALGNPANMGFCIACFLRDIAGACSLHGAAKVQYVRPEIIGLVLGSFIMALVKGEFRAKGGSSPATRFVLGAFVMIGALAFLGCPLRMVIRLGGGDLKRGFSLRRNYTLGVTEGTILPALMVGLLILVVAVPSLFKFSEAGPGSLFAPFFAALGIALVVGALAQRSRLCMVGGVRDSIMFGDFKLLYGFVAIFAVVLVGNLITNNFKLGFAGQPVAHSDHVWNLLGMLLVGWGSVLLGGCPLRQLILAGEGNSDSTVTVFGMIAGAAFAHNFGLAGAAANAESAGGVSTAGRIAVIIGILVVLAVSLLNMPKKKEA